MGRARRPRVRRLRPLPAPPDLKDSDDFFAVWGGISGAQSLLALLLDAGHHERGVGLERIAALTAAGPAERLRLARKGRIAPGADADVVLADVRGRAAITRESLFYRHPHSPYVERTPRGRIERTLVRGTTVFAGGRIVAPPRGRLVTPDEAPEERR